MPQEPFVHVPPMPGHAEPEGVHTCVTQQPPPVHAFPAQQVSPAPPHA